MTLTAPLDLLAFDSSSQTVAFTYNNNSRKVYMYNFKTNLSNSLEFKEAGQDVGQLIWVNKKLRYLAIILPKLITIKILSVSLLIDSIQVTSLY